MTSPFIEGGSASMSARVAGDGSFTEEVTVRRYHRGGDCTSTGAVMPHSSGSSLRKVAPPARE